MTNKADTQTLIREIQENVAKYGRENTTTYLMVKAITALQQQDRELEAVGAGGVQPLQVAPKAAPVSEQQAFDMGAKGAEPTDTERLLFEAWMRGHCWSLCATWDGRSYRSDAEQDGNLDPRAMNTRQLWAAWRDRAALAAQGGE